MAHSNRKPEIVHYVYHHDPNRTGQTVEDVFCYWLSERGAYLTRQGGKLPSRLQKPAKCNITIPPGDYVHFKGGLYHVVNCLELFRTGLFYVVYFSLKSGESIKWYYRAADEFSEVVDRGSGTIQRFRKI